MPDTENIAAAEPLPETGAHGDRERRRTPIRQNRIIGTAARAVARGGTGFTLVAAMLAVAVFFGLAWLCWLNWMPRVWNWGYSELGWESFVAWIGLLYLGIIPFGAIPLFTTISEFWVEYDTARREVENAREKQGAIEDDLKADDKSGLVQLVSYSRYLLREYYALATNQARRSFRYCLIAMWIGFAVLLLGVADYYLPLREAMVVRLGLSEQLANPASREGLSPNEFVLITGAIIEFVAAAFLWVHRFSITQQTYYYRRQMRLHNALFAHRLGEDMTEGRDEAIKLIVASLLEDVAMQETEAPTGKKLAALAKKNG